MNPKDQKTPGRDLPDWKCERFLLGELDAEEMQEIERAMDRDEALRGRIEAMARSNAEILRAYPPGWMERRIREKMGTGAVAASRARRDRRSWLPWQVMVPAGVAAVIAFAVFVSPHLFTDRPGTAFEATRPKGSSPQLLVHRKTSTGSEPLENGALAAAHDLVLLEYRTDAPGYGVILSVDGRGKITRHLPAAGDGAVEIERGRPHFMDRSYELDDAPSWELFYFVTAPSPFAIDLVARSIETALSASGPEGEPPVYGQPPQPLSLPEGFRVTRFALIKEPGHEE